MQSEGQGACGRHEGAEGDGIHSFIGKGVLACWLLAVLALLVLALSGLGLAAGPRLVHAMQFPHGGVGGYLRAATPIFRLFF